MAPSVNWLTRVITVPQSDLALIGGVIYEHDVDAFQRALSDIEDDEAGSAQPAMHRHNTEITLAGVVYIRSVEIINGFTVTYEAGAYRVNLTGANNNIIDVLNYNSVQVVANNSAGLQVVTQGSGVTAQDKLDIAAEVWSTTIAASLSAEELTRILAAALAGKVSGAAGPNVVFRNLEDTADAITATVDVSGNRTAVTLNPA